MATKRGYEWAAGVLEANGTIQIVREHLRNSARYTLRVKLRKGDKAIVDAFAQAVGGTDPVHVVRSGKNLVYEWYTGSARAGEVLRYLSPYLRTPEMREKARVGLEFQKQKTRRPGEKYTAEQERYFAEMRKLNA
jgi:hypothetical protein